MSKRGFLAGAGVLSLLLVGSTQAQVQFTGPVTDIDGRIGDQYTGPGSRDVQIMRRPMGPNDNTLTLENISIHDVLNQKGIDIGARMNPDGSVWTYSDITVSHYDNSANIRTIPGLHIDGLRISGAGNLAAEKTNVTLTDIHIRDGSTLPINIQDGNFGTITLRDIQIDGNDLNQLQIATIHSGHIDHIIVEDCPGLSVAVMSQLGSVGDITVLNSPGSNVSQKLYGDTYTGAIPMMASAVSASSFSAVPEPTAGIGLITLLGFVGARRSRRKH